MSAAALEALQAEIARLERDGRREIAERIRVAREWGDLKENAEYHDAKKSQAPVASSATGAERTYALVSATEADAASGAVSFQSPVGRALDGARIGDTVVVATPKGERRLAVIAIA